MLGCGHLHAWAAAVFSLAATRLCTNVASHLQVRDWYVESFRELRGFPKVKDASDELQFTRLLQVGTVLGLFLHVRGGGWAGGASCSSYVYRDGCSVHWPLMWRRLPAQSVSCVRSVGCFAVLVMLACTCTPADWAVSSFGPRAAHLPEARQCGARDGHGRG